MLTNKSNWTPVRAMSVAPHLGFECSPLSTCSSSCFGVSLIKFHILFSVGGHLHLKICELQLVVLILYSHTHVHAQHQPNRVLQSLWVIFTKCTTFLKLLKIFFEWISSFRPVSLAFLFQLLSCSNQSLSGESKLAVEKNAVLPPKVIPKMSL